MFSKLFSKFTSKEIHTVVLLALTAGAIAWLPGRLDVVVSGSLAHRIFLLCRPPAKIETGDYIVFRYDYDYKLLERGLTGTTRFTKEVGCAPGDMLRVDANSWFFCNGKPLGQALKTDSHEDTLPLFVFNGVIPPDNYFTIGSNPRSFDSKYFGFIKKNEILYKAYPIW